FFPLEPVLGIGIDEGPFGVAVFVTAIGTGELAVDKDDDAGLGRSGTARVTGENAGAGCCDHAGFLRSEEAQWHLHRSVLSLQAHWFTRESIQQSAAHRGGGYGQELSAFHISFSGFLKYRLIIASLVQWVSASTVKVGLGAALCGK